MSRRIISNLVLLLLLFVYTMVYRLVVFKDFLLYSEYITASVMIVLAFLSILLLGFRKNKTNILKKNINFTTIALIMLYFTITYSVGLLVGFLKNSYSLTFPTIMENMIAPMIIIICTEIFRYVIISANKDRKFILVFATVLLTFFEICISMRSLFYSSFPLFFKDFTLKILPIISKNIVMSYLVYHSGYKTTLFYRLTMELYIYLVPVVPDLGEYISSILGICFPILIYIRTSHLLDYHYYGEPIRIKRREFGIGDGLSLGFIALVLALMAGVLPYSIMGIGSGSMNPVINKGDLIFFEKVTSGEELEIGDILVFDDGKKDVIHRLVEVEKVDDKIYYRTKGDANNAVDTYDTELEDIKGKVKFWIPYVAYPSIFVTEALSK